MWQPFYKTTYLGQITASFVPEFLPMSTPLFPTKRLVFYQMPFGSFDGQMPLGSFDG